MKLHSVGSILDNMTSTDIAFCTKGVCEGIFIVSDKNDEDRLKNIYPDGRVVEGFYFRTPDEIPFEKRKEWVILREVEDEILKAQINRKFVVSLGETIKKGYRLNVK